MFEFIFDLPLAITGFAILGALALFAIGGLLTVRRCVLPRLRVEVEDSEFTGTLMQSIMVFYGLAVALMAVNVSQTYTDVAGLVSGEATALAALYRDVSGYPDAIRPQLQEGLRNYTRYTIDEAWPLQRRGEVPHRGVGQIDRFQVTLIAFEPQSDGQRILHAETLRAYNHMIQARRLRLDAVSTGLPSVMWAVIIVGAFISLSSSFFFKVADVRLHLLLVSLLAVFMGLVIFMILALDRPFRGELGLSADPYRLIYEQLMDR